jgi:hypothetical protein
LGRLQAFKGVPLRDLKLSKMVAAAIDVNGDLYLYGSGLGNGQEPKKVVIGKDLVQVAITTDSVFTLARSGVVYSFKLDAIESGKLAGSGWWGWLGSMGGLRKVQLSNGGWWER